jgi:molybdenum cofactor cytidylyltransferase
VCVSFPQKSVPHCSEVTPIILAAGASTRMGQRKERLQFGELICLDLAVAACAGAGLAEPIVVTRNDRAEELRRHLEGRGTPATIAINPQPDLGQTSSLRAGLKILPERARAFLIFPVDFPLVRSRDIERLCDVFVKESPAATVIAPSFARRRGHPVLVDAAVAPSLLALPEGASARLALAPLAERTRYVEVADDRLLQDMDTPEDYARCLARWAFGG